MLVSYCAPGAITTGEGGGAQTCPYLQEPLWLVWRYEGDYTLYDLMQKKDWPYNLEPLLFGRELNIPKGPERRWLSLRVVMKQAGHQIV